MKDFFTDAEGTVRCTIGSSSKIKHYGFENVSKSNDLGNFNKRNKSKYINKSETQSIYTKNINNNYDKVGSKLYITTCPRCGADVYFCKCSNGGKVFFDSLSPTWDKHPCTNANYVPSVKDLSYTFIYPTSIHQNNIMFNKFIPCLGRFKIPTSNNKIFQQNIRNNVTLLIKCQDTAKFLTVIITQGKYKNHVLVEHKEFHTLRHLLSFLFFILKQKDVSLDKIVEMVPDDFSLFSEKDIKSNTKNRKKRKSFNLKSLDKSKISVIKSSKNK